VEEAKKGIQVLLRRKSLTYQA